MAEEGEDSEHFHGLATRLITLAMVPLALGIANEVYVVFEKVLKSSGSALVAAVVTALAFFALWFGFTFFWRQQQETARA